MWDYIKAALKEKKKREVVITVIILIISIALSIPQYKKDCAAYEAAKKRQVEKIREEKLSLPIEQGIGSGLPSTVDKNK